jgi:hypothetical protein
MGRNFEIARRIRVEFGGDMKGLGAVLETLNDEYTFDARGRMVASRAGGVLPRFVLGRAAEGCIWRFRADLGREREVALARLAGREGGARFDGELPAPPERIAALVQVLADAPASSSTLDKGTVRRDIITRGGVALGELWRIG